MDCRAYLSVKQYEFLFNFYLRAWKAAPSLPDEPLSYDGHSDYDQFYYQISQSAKEAFQAEFGEAPPPIALTNLFHLAELEWKALSNSKASNVMDRASAVGSSGA